MFDNSEPVIARDSNGVLPFVRANRNDIEITNSVQRHQASIAKSYRLITLCVVFSLSISPHFFERLLLESLSEWGSLAAPTSSNFIGGDRVSALLIYG